MFSRRIASVRGLLALGLCIWAGPSAASAIWGIQPVATSGFEQGHNPTSVALNATHSPRIAYYEGSDRELHYAEKNQGLWLDTTVDSAGIDTGRWASLAIDASGNPHISYSIYINDNGDVIGDLKYATRSGGVWTTQTVDASGVTGEYTSIAVDAQGNPHITYYNNSDGDLKYARKSNGNWVISRIDSIGNVGAYTSLALDSQGRPHVAYRDVGGFGVRYAAKLGASWTVEPVASLVFAAYISMDLDSQDRPHIAYFDQSVNKTKYASKPGGSWVNSIAAALGLELNGLFTTLKVDSQDIPHMSYYEASTGYVMYAVKNGNGGAYWTLDTVSMNSGTWTGMVLDAGDHPHISYYVASQTGVQYAVFTDNTSDFEPGPATTLLTLDAFPNPVRTSTTLILRSPQTVPLDLRILDARGRLVRDLGHRELSPGTHAITWDGRDDAGSSVGAGVYFAVTRPSALATSRKLVVLR